MSGRRAVTVGAVVVVLAVVVGGLLVAGRTGRPPVAKPVQVEGVAGVQEADDLGSTLLLRTADEAVVADPASGEVLARMAAEPGDVSPAGDRGFFVAGQDGVVDRYTPAGDRVWRRELGEGAVTVLASTDDGITTVRRCPPGGSADGPCRLLVVGPDGATVRDETRTGRSSLLLGIYGPVPTTAVDSYKDADGGDVQVLRDARTGVEIDRLADAVGVVVGETYLVTRRDGGETRLYRDGEGVRIPPLTGLLADVDQVSADATTVAVQTDGGSIRVLDLDDLAAGARVVPFGEPDSVRAVRGAAAVPDGRDGYRVRVPGADRAWELGAGAGDQVARGPGDLVEVGSSAGWRGLLPWYDAPRRLRLRAASDGRTTASTQVEDEPWHVLSPRPGLVVLSAGDTVVYDLG